MGIVIWQDGQEVAVQDRADSAVVQSSSQTVEAKSAVIVGGIPYAGSYEVTPGATAQTLPTASRMLAQDITINPIPSNYGLVTWDGSSLMVS